MGAPFFRFKQFTVWHDCCAMKVGTDGVLLGAWCPLPRCACARVLDIGTGSGLIALMTAQRLQSSLVDAIDIDEDAAKQAKYNFEKSPWSQRIYAHQSTLQNWNIDKEDIKYDLIVSNPPYFQSSLKNPNQARATARHTDTLSYRELICHSARLLAKKGILALILPAESDQEILSLAKEYHLMPTHVTYVHSKPGKDARRILMAFCHKEITSVSLQTSDFYIESETSPRSEEYQELTKEFYL